MEVVSWGSSARLVNQWCVVVAVSEFQLAPTCESQRIIAGRDDPQTKEMPAIAGMCRLTSVEAHRHPGIPDLAL